MYIAIAILVFGFLIIIHELGHFLTAKAFNVKVVEFSVGMGPRLLKKQGKETLFSLRALPIGGSCMMEGEDEETQDPRSFTAQARWKRFIILIDGSCHRPHPRVECKKLRQQYAGVLCRRFPSPGGSRLDER
jgi:regulator of sigma E protease